MSLNSRWKNIHDEGMKIIMNVTRPQTLQLVTDFLHVAWLRDGNVSQSFRQTVMIDNLAGGKLPSGYFGEKRLVGGQDCGAQSERSDETFGLSRELEA